MPFPLSPQRLTEYTSGSGFYFCPFVTEKFDADEALVVG